MTYNVFGGMLNLVQLQLIFVVTYCVFALSFMPASKKNHVRNDAGGLKMQRYYCLIFFGFWVFIVPLNVLSK